MAASAFAAPGRWLRGNLHGHTAASDGRLSPEDYVAAYRARGYDFVAATDHWRLTDLRPFRGEGFAVVPGAEVDGRAPAPFGHHVVALGIGALPARSPDAALQDTVDAVRALGGVAVVAHPYETGLTSAHLLAADGYVGLEVWNTLSVVGWGKGVATVQWDEVLQAGRRVAGLATDDTHQRGGRLDDLGLGWVMVRADAPEPDAVLAALAAGRFYASTGPEIHDFRVELGPDGALHARVACSRCRFVHFLCDRGLGRTVAAPEAEGGPESGLETASQRLNPAATYVRVQCEDRRGRTAWGPVVDLRPGTR